jgi:hypothetical protein
LFWTCVCVCVFFFFLGPGRGCLSWLWLAFSWCDLTMYGKAWVEVGQQIWEGVSRSPFCATKDLRSSNLPVVQNTFA